MNAPVPVPVAWGPDTRGLVKLVHKMTGDNFYAEDPHGVSFCVNPSSRIDRHKNCDVMQRLFDLGFKNVNLLRGLELLIEVKHAVDKSKSKNFQWMAATCRYDLQPNEIKLTIDEILEKAEKCSAIVHQPQISNSLENFVDEKPDVIIRDVEFTVVDLDSIENNRIQIKNAFLSKIIKAVAKENGVHVSEVAAACVKYCITHDSILFRMRFNDKNKGQIK